MIIIDDNKREVDVFFVKDYAFHNLKLTSNYEKDYLVFYNKKYEMLVIKEGGDILRFCNINDKEEWEK